MHIAKSFAMDCCLYMLNDLLLELRLVNVLSAV